MQRRGNGTLVVQSLGARTPNSEAEVEINELPNGRWIYGDKLPHVYVESEEALKLAGFVEQQIALVRPYLAALKTDPEMNKKDVEEEAEADFETMCKQLAPEERAEVTTLLKNYFKDRKDSALAPAEANSAGDGYGQATPQAALDVPYVDGSGGYIDPRPHPETGKLWWRPHGVTDAPGSMTTAMTPEQIEAEMGASQEVMEEEDAPVKIVVNEYAHSIEYDEQSPQKPTATTTKVGKLKDKKGRFTTKKKAN